MQNNGLRGMVGFEDMKGVIKGAAGVDEHRLGIATGKLKLVDKELLLLAGSAIVVVIVESNLSYGNGGDGLYPFF